MEGCSEHNHIEFVGSLKGILANASSTIQGSFLMLAYRFHLRNIGIYLLRVCFSFPEASETGSKLAPCGFP